MPSSMISVEDGGSPFRGNYYISNGFLNPVSRSRVVIDNALRVFCDIIYGELSVMWSAVGCFKIQNAHGFYFISSI